MRVRYCSHFTIQEGRKHIVRRMLATLGLRVKRLKRLSHAGISIDRIPIGGYREITSKEYPRLINS